MAVPPSPYGGSYLLLRSEGLRFLDTWFGSKRCVPANQTRLYQLVLHMVTMRGRLSVYVALKIGYSSKLIGEAVSKRYVQLSRFPEKPSDEVSDRIRQIIGNHPREMLVGEFQRAVGTKCKKCKKNEATRDDGLCDACRFESVITSIDTFKKGQCGDCGLSGEERVHTLFCDKRMEKRERYLYEVEL